MTSVRRITAAAPLSMLVAALSRVQWGPLAGAKNRPAQLILLALGSNAQHIGLDSAGEITITANQLADMAGYSDRHLRRWMPVLEGLGLIQWRRGGVVAGKPEPGTLRVSKKLLAQWVRDWTARADAVIEERRLKTLARLKALTNLRIPPYRPRWKRHADMLASPPPSTRGEQGDSAPRPLPPAGDLTPNKKDIPVLAEFMPETCSHRPGGDPWYCNACRFTANLAEQQHKRAVAAERARREAELEAANEARANAWVDYMQENYGHLTRRQWVTISNDGSDPEATRLNRMVTA